MYFRYNGKDITLKVVFESDKKRRKRSRYLLSVTINDWKDDKVILAKVVYVIDKNKRNSHLWLISTNTSLNENEIVKIYNKSCGIKVFFEVCISYLISPRNADQFLMMR